MILVLVLSAMVDVNLGGLSLDGDEEEGISLGIVAAEEVSDIQLRLVGRFLIDRPIWVTIMKERMAEIWRPVKGLVIKKTSSNLFLFQFFHKKDLESVARGGPRSFDNHVKVDVRQPLKEECEVMFSMEEEDDGVRGWGIEL